MAREFNPGKIEDKWVMKWKQGGIFDAASDPGKKKFYLTVAYPYPSGSMHVGHGRTYTVPDVIARYKRMCGYNVLFPMAWHVTGSPVLGIAKRIKRKDAKTLNLYGGLYKVPAETLKEFHKPENIVSYFSDEYKRNMEKLGFSIDWSREFLTTTPQYNKFIEWQYRTLKRKNLVRKDEHPVRYCPSCDNPVGDHDLMEGETSTINKFVILKFTCNEMILPAATLRPETVFGVTNMWLNPNITYRKVNVGKEIWLLSEEAVEKMKHCGTEMEVVGKMKGEELIGGCCVDPVNGREIPILSADFVDPEYATGVVMSVPAHAPYDYMALKDLGSDIKPIVIIESEGTEGIPAENIIKDMRITNQRDKKLEKATEILYRAEHSKGYMKKEIKGYGGMPVAEARDKLTGYLIDCGRGDIFHEFSESPVVCRCGARCVIKILKDQWFLSYDKKQWKEKVHRCLDGMKIIPDELRQNFSYVIDWLNEWACTRRVGLGTKLPWDKNWIIEPLSDSTIYMSYYTISGYLKEIKPEKLGDEFFNYVFLGEGNTESVAEKAGISGKKLDEISGEFNYWYPLDWRLSAKDLVGNHLTFHLFHHTAIFPEDKWPKGIVVFGMGLLEGQKMSSSKGNIILLEDAIEKYGSDAVRLFLMSNAEPWQDFDWREDQVKNTLRKLKQFYDQVNHAITFGDAIPERDIDRWLMCRFNMAVLDTREAMDGFQTRKALQHAFYGVLNDFTWYLRRCKPNAEVLRKVAGRWVKLMSPFTPFICEELGDSLGGEDFVSLSSYPDAQEEDIDEEVIQKEELIKTLMEDIQNIREATKVKPEKIYLYIAPQWKRRLFKAISKGEGKADIMGDPQFRKHGGEVIKIIQNTRRDEVPGIICDMDEESRTISDARDFLETEFNAEINVQVEPSYDPKGKAKYALPMKPGIYIEGS